VVFRPPVFNRYILAFDKRGLAQAPLKRRHGLPGVTGRLACDESHDRHLRLLRARHTLPCGCRAAEQRYEIARFLSNMGLPQQAPTVCPTIAHQARQEIAALRDFDPAYRRNGSKPEIIAPQH
jgi:hypothetical protein